MSRADKNAKGVDEVVQVRRPDYVTINMKAYEEQQRLKAEWKEEDRRRRKELDPDRLGLYGPIDYYEQE